MNYLEFPYSLTPNRLKSFIEQIPRMGIPMKVTTRTLPAMGFKSTNDRTLVVILKSLNLVDDTGVPTPDWQKMRSQDQMRLVLATRIREAYAPLFQLYPDAHERSEVEVRDFIRAHTKSGDRVVTAMVTTFRMLCSLADFSSAPESTNEKSHSSNFTPSGHGGSSPYVPQNQGSTRIGDVPLYTASNITINLQIQLPEVVDYEYVDAIFESMARHILGREIQASSDDEDLFVADDTGSMDQTEQEEPPTLFDGEIVDETGD